MPLRQTGYCLLWAELESASPGQVNRPRGNHDRRPVGLNNNRNGSSERAYNSIC